VWNSNSRIHEKWKGKVMATRKKKEEWPKVVVGSHLTVTTYENGKTELKWDDEALARDVHEALESVKKVKPKKEKKNVEKTKQTIKSK
jgi:hypothetical protein